MGRLRGLERRLCCERMASLLWEKPTVGYPGTPVSLFNTEEEAVSSCLVAARVPEGIGDAAADERRR